MEEIAFVKVMIDRVDGMVADYLDSRPTPGPPPRGVTQHQASSTMANSGKPLQFPSDLSRVVRVVSPRQGDHTTARERLSYRMAMPGPSLHGAPSRGARVSGGASESD